MGMPYEDFVGIYEKYGELNKKEYAKSAGVSRATEFSKYLDGLHLPSAQDSYVRDEFKFMQMFPAAPKGYRLGLMSGAAQRGWGKVQRKVDISEAEYVSLYPILYAEGMEKGEKINALIKAGLSSDEAYRFWNTVRGK